MHKYAVQYVYMDQAIDNEKQVLYSFTTKEHTYYERSIDFYWAVGIIGAVLATLAFIFKDALFGILIIIGFFLYGYSSYKRPKDVDVIVTNKDITIGDDVFNIAKISAYRILDIGNEKDVVFLIKRSYQPRVSVTLPEGIADSLKNALNQILEEDTTIVPHVGRRFMARFKI